MYDIKDINNAIKNLKSEDESTILYLGGEFVEVKSEEVIPNLSEEYSKELFQFDSNLNKKCEKFVPKNIFELSICESKAIEIK